MPVDLRVAPRRLAGRSPALDLIEPDWRLAGAPESLSAQRVFWCRQTLDLAAVLLKGRRRW